MTTEIVKANTKGQLIRRFAEKYGVDEGQVASILKATAFSLPSKRNEAPKAVTNEEMAALLIVADQYGLNPFIKEIYAFPDKKGGIVPIISVDGWAHILNAHPQFDGLDFRASETIVEPADGRPCPEWIESVIYRRDRTRPIVTREYLDECYREPFTFNNGDKSLGPWQTHTKRMLRHKALIQGARLAFGFAGIHDLDEAETIVDVTPRGANIPPTQAIDCAVPFEEIFIDENKGQLEEFVQATANIYGVDGDEVKRNASAKPAEFRVAFHKWQAQNKGRPTQTPSPTPVTPQASSPARDEAGPGMAAENQQPAPDPGPVSPPPAVTDEEQPDADAPRMIERVQSDRITVLIKELEKDRASTLRPYTRTGQAYLKDITHARADDLIRDLEAELAAKKVPPAQETKSQTQGYVDAVGAKPTGPTLTEMREDIRAILTARDLDPDEESCNLFGVTVGEISMAEARTWKSALAESETSFQPEAGTVEDPAPSPDDEKPLPLADRFWKAFPKDIGKPLMSKYVAANAKDRGLFVEDMMENMILNADAAYHSFVKWTRAQEEKVAAFEKTETSDEDPGTVAAKLTDILERRNQPLQTWAEAVGASKWVMLTVDQIMKLRDKVKERGWYE